MRKWRTLLRILKVRPIFFDGGGKKFILQVFRKKIDTFKCTNLQTFLDYTYKLASNKLARNFCYKFLF